MLGGRTAYSGAVQPDMVTGPDEEPPGPGEAVPHPDLTASPGISAFPHTSSFPYGPPPPRSLAGAARGLPTAFPDTPVFGQAAEGPGSPEPPVTQAPGPVPPAAAEQRVWPPATAQPVPLPATNRPVWPATTEQPEPPRATEQLVWRPATAQPVPPATAEPEPPQATEQLVWPPATERPPVPGAFPDGAGTDGTTTAVAAGWVPPAADMPGVFTDPSGRRRVRLRWLALAAGAALGSFLLVTALGLLGGPKAPLLPWPRVAAQPPPGGAGGVVPGSHQHRASRPHAGVNTTPTTAAPGASGPQAASSPGSAGSGSGQAATPAPAAAPTAAPPGTPPTAPSTAPSASASQHIPPGKTHQPSGPPSKTHPA